MALGSTCTCKGVGVVALGSKGVGWGGVALGSKGVGWGEWH